MRLSRIWTWLGTFLRFFPGGFQDETYISWERDYKWRAHLRWVELLDVATMREALYEFLHGRTTRAPYVPQANVTRRVANAYGFEFVYRSRPTWETYSCFLAFAERVRKDQRKLRPRDMIDLQSFIWVQGSDEYH